MNLMFVSGRWPWTIIRSERSRRSRYFAALDKAHVTRTEIHDFAEFLREEMNVDWGGGENLTRRHKSASTLRLTTSGCVIWRRHNTTLTTN